MKYTLTCIVKGGLISIDVGGMLEVEARKVMAAFEDREVWSTPGLFTINGPNSKVAIQKCEVAAITIKADVGQ